MKKLIGIFLIAGVFMLAGCEKQELLSYDPYNGDTLVKFHEPNTFLSVANEPTVEIQVDSSSLSGEARTVTIAVDTENEENTADPTHYSFVSEAVIPSGEHSAYFEFTGNDNVTAGETVVLKITSITGGGSFEESRHKVVMF